MNRPNRISYAFIVLIFVLTGWAHLGVLLLSVLFSYFIISKLDFMKPKARWLAVAVFLVILGALAYALTHLIHATVTALPSIAERAVPAIVQWAQDHQIELPFTNLETLKDQAMEFAQSQAHNLGTVLDFARGATTQFIYFLVGCVVAMGLFLNPNLEMDPPSRAQRDNLYSLCCEEIGRRFATFYQSFAMVMKAQVIIALIDSILTGIFVSAMGLSYVMVAVGATFLCGLLPVVGNLLSNTVVVGLGFMVSPAKGLAALAFLVTIHQLEYILNSRIIGGKIRSPLWLTLLGLVVGAGLMGVTGMILAPVILHYIRIETAEVHVNHKAK